MISEYLLGDCIFISILTFVTYSILIKAHTGFDIIDLIEWLFTKDTYEEIREVLQQVRDTDREEWDKL